MFFFSLDFMHFPLRILHIASRGAENFGNTTPQGLNFVFKRVQKLLLGKFFSLNIASVFLSKLSSKSFFSSKTHPQKYSNFLRFFFLRVKKKTLPGEQCLFFVSVRAQNTNNHCVDGYIIIHWLRAQRKKHQFGPRIIIISINLGTAQKNPTQYLHPVKFSELVAPIPVFWLFM